MSERVTAAAQRAGINPATSAHWLRHAHASHAIDGGAPITLVSQTLGHTDLKTTSVYAHAKPNVTLAMSGPVTIADLMRDRRLLWVHCNECGRAAPLRMSTFPQVSLFLVARPLALA